MCHVVRMHLVSTNKYYWSRAVATTVCNKHIIFLLFASVEDIANNI